MPNPLTHHFTLQNCRVLKTDLLGRHQQKNISLGWNVLQILKTKGWHFDDIKSEHALKRVQKNTGFAGRMQVLQEAPKVILDAAHNQAGIELLFKEIESLDYDRLHCVFGSSSDKSFMTYGNIFLKSAMYYLTSYDSPRSATRSDLEKLGDQYQLNYNYYSSPEIAFKAAKQQAKSTDLILVFGSFFILEKIF